MSRPGLPLPVKPVVSMLLAREDLAPGILHNLAEHFGPPDLVSSWLPFSFTEYYSPEMGPHLGRVLVAFLHLADPGHLDRWKVFTNAIEERLALGGKRTVNLDPGYVARERLILASGKNFTHRVYLDQGIYGDLTLIYSGGKFSSLSWTFPDYAQGPVPELVDLVRRKYLWQLKALSNTVSQ